jgi:hypothetical protein
VGEECVADPQQDRELWLATTGHILTEGALLYVGSARDHVVAEPAQLLGTAADSLGRCRHRGAGSFEGALAALTNARNG